MNGIMQGVRHCRHLLMRTFVALVLAGCAPVTSDAVSGGIGVSWAVFPKVGQTFFNTDVTEMGTITSIDRENASVKGKGDIWTWVSHQRRIINPQGGSQWPVAIHYTCSTEEPFRFYAVGIGTDSPAPHGVSAKSIAELRDHPLWLEKSFHVTERGVSQEGELCIVTFSNIAPEKSLQAVFIPTTQVGREPQSERECLYQTIEWTKESGFSVALSSQEWKTALWREIPMNR
jgi:hypothetical protein